MGRLPIEIFIGLTTTHSHQRRIRPVRLVSAEFIVVVIVADCALFPVFHVIGRIGNELWITRRRLNASRIAVLVHRATAIVNADRIRPAAYVVLATQKIA